MLKKHIVQIYHPNKSKPADRDKKTVKFREIQEAYEFLVKHLSA
jgi:DnaJ-class molecular chaperone